MSENFSRNIYYRFSRTRCLSLIEKADEEIISGWEKFDEMFFEDENEEDVVSLIVAYIKKKMKGNSESN